MTSQQDGLDLKAKLLFYCWSYALSSVLHACHEGSFDTSFVLFLHVLTESKIFTENSTDHRAVHGPYSSVVTSTLQSVDVVVYVLQSVGHIVIHGHRPSKSEIILALVTPFRPNGIPNVNTA